MKINTRIMVYMAMALVLLAVLLGGITLWQFNWSKKAAISQIEAMGEQNILRIQKDGEQMMTSYREELMEQKKNQLQSQVQTTIGVLEKAYEDAHHLENLKQVYRDPLQNAVDTAFGLLEEIDKDPGLGQEEKKQKALHLIQNLRYGPEQKDYFWINDTTPTMVMHPYKPDLDGKDLSDYKDPNGKPLFVEFVKACRETGQGFVDYDWPKYGADKPQPKLSFVKLFKPWNWILGSGVYLEVAEAKLQQTASAMIGALRYGPDNQDYFWINDTTPTMIMHPYKPELNGKDLSQIKDPNGKALFMDFVKVCKDLGEGFVEYDWPKYGADKPQPKLSFVKLFIPWNWIIGTGIYIDDVNQRIEERKKQIDEAIAKVTTGIEAQVETVKVDYTQKAKTVISGMIGGGGLATVLMLLISLYFIRRSIIAPIRSIIQGLSESTVQVSAVASEVASASQTLAAGATQQAAAVEESSVSLEQMAARSRQSVLLTMDAKALMNENIEKSAQSMKALVELTQSMTHIEKDSGNIGQIIKTIDEIAFQTNLLALNAAVEAARAGEAGAGFAVVADEVRNLAQRSTTAAKRTQELLQRTLKRVSDAAEAIRSINSDFEGIISSATVMGEKTESATTATEDQARGIEKLRQAAQEINQVTQRVAASAEEQASASEELSSQSIALEEHVRHLASMVTQENGNGAKPKGKQKALPMFAAS